MANRNISLDVLETESLRVLSDNNIYPEFVFADLAAKLLAWEEASTLSYTDPSAAYNIFKENDGLHSLPFLRHAVLENILRNMGVMWKEKTKTEAVTEKQIESFFYKNLGKYIKNASKAERVKRKQGFVPDGFLLLDGKIAPVEVKKKDFNSRALVQLLSYMIEYKADVGIAVSGGALTCEIPDNIIFVRVDTDEVMRTARSA